MICSPYCPFWKLLPLESYLPFLLASPCRVMCEELMTSDMLWVNSLKSTKPADNSTSRWFVKTGLMWETLSWIQQGGGVFPDVCIGTRKYWKVMAAALIWDSGISGMHAYMPGCVLVVAQISAVEGCSPWAVDATILSSLTSSLVSSAHNHNWKIDIRGAKPS